MATDIQAEITAYDALRADLEARYMGKWVLIYEGKLQGTFDTIELAAEEAVKRFGVGPYLIRQVGAAAVTFPASVVYHLAHA